MENHKLTIRLFVGRFFSHLAVLAVCLLCLWPLYRMFLDQVSRNATSNVARQVALAGQSWDDEMTALRRTTNKVFNEPAVAMLAMLDNSQLEQEPILPLEASGELQSLTYSFSFGSYEFLTFAGNDMVLDTFRSFSSRERFYASAMTWNEVSFAEWNDYSLSSEFRILPVREIALNTSAFGERYLIVQQPYETTSGKFRGNFNLLLLERDLLNLFLPFDNAESYLFALSDANGNLLCTQNYTGQLPPSAGENATAHTIGDERYILLGQSLSNGLQVTVGIPSVVYTQASSEIHRIILKHLALTLLVYIALEIALALRDIHNLKPLLEQLDKTENATSREFSTQYLYRFLNEQLNDRTKLRSELANTRTLLQHTQAESFLRTGQATEHTRQELTALFGLQKKNYLLLLYFPENTAGQDELFYLALRQAASDIFGGERCVFQASEQEYLVFLPDSDRTQSALQNGIGTLREQLPAEVRFILSSHFDSIDRASAAYWQVHNAIPAARLSSASVFRLSPETLSQVAVAEVGQLNRLNDCLLTGQVEQAVEMIHQMFVQEYLGPQGFQQLFYSVRGVLLSAAQQCSAPDITHLCVYSAQRPPQKLIDDLCDCCFEIGNHIDGIKRSHNVKMRNDILQYLDDHYSDPNLCVAMVADHFGISKKYFSQFMHDQTGKTYTDYIEELRLSRAMALLQNSDVSITEIALQCGFSTQNTFYKAFRKHYGVSPSAVRRKD